MQPQTIQMEKSEKLVIDEEYYQRIWDINNIFQKSIAQPANSIYTFYDGPPFMTGKPHYGHMLAGFGKDTVTRFHTQKNKYVPRRSGSDCHGLPIEYEIEKEKGIKTRKQIEEIGIGTYNEYCRSIVLRCASDWEKTMDRIGRWVDFKNDYKTMDFDYMNSVWWVFSELAKKGLIYSSYRVMPYSVECKTPLSNFETAQNYQDVDDITVFVKFKLINQQLTDLVKSNISLLVWTTTPWTLPSNIAIAINKESKYSLVKSDNEYYVIISSLANKVFGLAKKTFELISEFTGDKLLDCCYVPLFDCYPITNLTKSFKIIHGDFVTDSDGFVHIAPSYGEDDYNVCVQNNIIKTTDTLFMSINDEGYFYPNLKSIEDLGGKFYKNHGKNNKFPDANSLIIQKLRQNGSLFLQNKYRHQYPFCWRSDTPLMYRAIKSWFVKVEPLKERMVELNKTINWVPDFVGKGRFHQWLSQAKDWCIARNRYWGTPIPIWENINDPSDYIVISSAAELEQLSHLPPNSIKDIHRDKIDQIILSINGKQYKRSENILDCWFESGSMPYASIGYPYKTKNINFPADFIAEGIDQTRGWFYTLLIISTALFDSVPFKNVIVNGLVLAADGKKMSKRLKNYPDPMDIVNKYGSDALRLYLLNSPASKGDVLKFNEMGVYGMVRDMIIPLKSTFNFYSEYESKFKQTFPNESLYDYSSSNGIKEIISENPLDCYAIKYICKEIKNIYNNLDKYLISEAIKNISNIIELLNNLYIKYNRFSLKGKNKENICSWKNSLSVLKYVLNYLVINIAPLMPFFAEYAFQKLIGSNSTEFNSIHLMKFENIMIPNLNQSQNLMADEMIHVLNTLKLVMGLRSRHNIGMKNPIENIIMRTSPEIQQILNKYSNFILDELNILNLTTDNFDLNDINIELMPNFKEIKSVYSNVEKIIKIINKIAASKELKIKAAQNIELEIDGVKITPSMIVIVIKPNSLANHISDYQFIDNSNYCVYANTNMSEISKIMAYSRFIATKFQKLKKEFNIKPIDNVKLAFFGKPEYDLFSEQAINIFIKICGRKIEEMDTETYKTAKLICKTKLYEEDEENNIELLIY